MTKKEVDELRIKAEEAGAAYEKKYRGCAQCTFAALQDALGLRNEYTDAIFKAASPMAGGGAAEADGHCGAYTGGMLMLGYMHGRERNNFEDPDKTRYRARDNASKFHRQFIDEYGSVTCEHIHRKIFGRTFYLRNKNDKDEYIKMGAYEDKCTTVVGRAAGWIIEILAEDGYL